eukprot:6694539-Alexandrium_andersonii.AAC.1
MSASLVGSEMCIRDRNVLQSTSIRNSPSVKCKIAQAFESGTVRAQAVSYTHLTLPTICSV